MNQTPLHIVILAAGKGMRMHSELPKVLHEIGGKPMLTHVIDTALSLKPQHIHVVIGYGKEKVRSTVERNVHWVEQTEQLGTGHAVKTVLPYLPEHGRTLVLYGDVPLIDHATLNTLLDSADHNAVGLLTDMPDNPAGYGRIVRENNKVVAVVEEKDANACQKTIKEINTGILVLPNAKLNGWLNRLNNHNAQKEYYLTDLIAMANTDGIAIRTVQIASSYLAAGVNDKIQLANLERLFQHHQAQALLKAGVTLIDPARFDLRGTLQHGKDIIIDTNVIIEGDVTLGDGVTIGANCVIRNSKIASGCTVAPFSYLDGCEAGGHSRIGPFARIRPYTKLAQNTHIGNFVEVKNTTLGIGSKANHLAYLGDAQIGNHTNIGAGTITANYNGVAKYQTVIGNEARIGANVVLVAPVSVGDKVTVGGGSTITKNCKDGTLVIARSRQTVIENWQRPEKESE